MADGERIDLTGGGGGGGGGEPEPAPEPRKRRGGGRRRTSSGSTAIETRLREAIVALAEWLAARGDEELGHVLERDAPKMADVLAAVAKWNPLALKVVGVLADVLEPVRAFGPTLRVLLGRLGDRRARIAAEREQADGLEDVTPLRHVPAGGGGEADEPLIAEPWKIR